MLKKKLLTIIIPAKNEQDSILKVLSEIEKKVKVPHKIIVVNDHSTDKTAELVKRYQKKNREISLVNNLKNRRGFSSALKTGFEKAKSEYVLPVMADICDDPVTINTMYKMTDKGWDIICGSRYMKGGKKIGGPLLQGVLSSFVCSSLHFITGIPTTDVSNAFKMYKRSILKDIYISEKSGVEASMEITLQAYFNGAKITELPTSWRGRSIGKSKFKILERAPLYFRIYSWAILNKFRKNFGMSLIKYSVNRL